MPGREKFRPGFFFMDGELRQIFRKHLPTILWVSIESASTEQGIPDMFYCASGCTGWLENKCAQANAVKISKMQIAWHERYARAGGRSFIAVRRISVLRREALFIYPGTALRQLEAEGLVLPTRFCWIGKPSAWDWRAISAIFLG